jgi:hypothetical protein
MAPIAIPVHEHIQEKDTVQPRKDSLGLPEPARKRLEKAGIDLSAGYPYRPAKPLYLDDVYKIRDYDREHIDPGSRADPEKKALFGAAKEEVIDATCVEFEGEGTLGVKLLRRGSVVRTSRCTLVRLNLNDPQYFKGHAVVHETNRIYFYIRCSTGTH